MIPLSAKQFIIGMLVIHTSTLLPLQDLSILLLLLGIYNFPVVIQTQEKHDNISVFEYSDNEDGPFTPVKEGPGHDPTGHDPTITHLNSVF